MVLDAIGIHPNHHFLNSGTCSSLEWTLEFKSSSLQPLYFIKFVLLLKKWKKKEGKIKDRGRKDFTHPRSRPRTQVCGRKGQTSNIVDLLIRKKNSINKQYFMYIK